MNIDELEQWTARRAFIDSVRTPSVRATVVHAEICEVTGCAHTVSGVLMIGSPMTVDGLDMIVGSGPVPLCHGHIEQLMERLAKHPGCVETRGDA